MQWNETTRKGYASLYAKMVIDKSRMQEATAVAKRLIGNRARYEAVQSKTNVPWWFIAILHQRESDANFNTYLGNGQSLNHVTTLVPAGRGPFYGADSFERGCIDALEIQGYTKIQDWSVEHALYLMEAFNGFGYTTHNVNSPYVWGGSNNYVTGKYVADGKFDANVKDKQLGGAIIMSIMSIILPALFGKAVSMVADAVTSPVEVAKSIATPVQLAPENAVTTSTSEALIHHSITALGLLLAYAGFSNAPHMIDVLTSLPFVGGAILAGFGAVLNVMGLNRANSNTLTMIDQVAQYIIQVERDKMASSTAQAVVLANEVTPPV